VGAWDPFNVTEDADLGIRLARFGYYAGTLTLPTFEHAPVAVRPWLRQRTRWLKGWMRPVNDCFLFLYSQCLRYSKA
jgi:cellulose synthase/poly-beta-1,6-N-acetylglucosamine synthase-like glycosyltransferase